MVSDNDIVIPLLGCVERYRECGFFEVEKGVNGESEREGDHGLRVSLLLARRFGGELAPPGGLWGGGEVVPQRQVDERLVVGNGGGGAAARSAASGGGGGRTGERRGGVGWVHLSERERDRNGVTRMSDPRSGLVARKSKHDRPIVARIWAWPINCWASIISQIWPLLLTTPSLFLLP